jgi:Recombination endonuclease VII
VETNETKHCPKCDTTKPRELFHRSASRGDGLRGWCKTCTVTSTAAYDANNANKVRVYRAAYKAKNVAATRAEAYMRTYGLSPEQFEDMGCAQDWRCAICSVPFESFRPAPHVDHCHSTGVVRGLLCPRCNSMLGQAQDSTEILGKAISYLTAAGTQAPRQRRGKLMVDAGIVERIDAALATARTPPAKTLGRPKVDEATEARIRRYRAQGHGINKTAKLAGVGVSVVQRVAATA